MLESSSSPFRFRAVCSRVSGLALLATVASIPALAQGRMAPGKSIGSVTTHGNLIILTLNEDALGKPHLFDLAHHTVRFTPEGSRYRVETLPETWDNDFGAEMKDSHATLIKLTFPFSGRSWSSFSVGVTGSITFAEPEAVPGRMRGGPPDRDGGLSVERYALLQRVGSTFIDGTPAISAFFKPRMTGTRYLKELSDRAVVTWSLSEPYGGIQDWTWKPTINRFQAVLHSDGVIELTYDEISARDAIVGIFPKIDGHEEKPIATLTPQRQLASSAQLSLKDVTLTNVDGIYLQTRIETVEPVAAQVDATTAPSFRLCLSLARPTEPCSDHLSGATIWTVQQARGFRGQRTGAAGFGSRYFALGPGVLPEVTVDKNALSFKGVLPAGVRSGSEIYVSGSVEGTDGAEGALLSAQPVRLQDLGSPEVRLADMKKQDGGFPVVYESFYYPESPRPNDLTCSVIKALGDQFDLLAYYSDFRIDNPEAGTPSTGPLGGGPNGGAVTGIGATQRNLASYCTQGRFQWQFVQPVYVGANQMDEYPPDDMKDDNRHNVVAYTHQLAERTFNGRIPPYDYAMSQIGHEMGHRWSAFVSAKINGELIPLGPTHWATGLQAPAAFPYQRPVEASAMGGGVWQDNFDGTYTQLDDDYYVPATGWSYLDLYLMGLIAPSEVPDFFLLRNLVPQGKDANGHTIDKADRTKITINDVIAAEGPRLPDVDHAQKHFNTGMVIVLEHGHTPPPELLERVEGIRLRWMDYWQTTTGHRSDMTTNPH